MILYRTFLFRTSRILWAIKIHFNYFESRCKATKISSKSSPCENLISLEQVFAECQTQINKSVHADLSLCSIDGDSLTRKVVCRDLIGWRDSPIIVNFCGFPFLVSTCYCCVDRLTWEALWGTDCISFYAKCWDIKTFLKYLLFSMNVWFLGLFQKVTVPFYRGLCILPGFK